MTVRQVFYQMVARGFIAKTENEYHTVVCRLLTKLRLNGTIPFGYIADNTRWMRKPRTYDSLRDALQFSHDTYRHALWSRMPSYVEVWIEKDALAGVIYGITEQYDAPLMVTKGYSSLSYLYEASEYIKGIGKPTHIYYLGDYDPSGVDIPRQIEKRLREFCDGIDIHFQILGVTELQIDEMRLPTRPTKQRDSRGKGFDSDISVELDAMSPDILRGLVAVAIDQHIDMDELARLQRIEAAEKESLETVMKSLPLDGSEKERL